MKVLQINAVSGIRSTGRICTEIADYLNDNGDEGYIAYSEGLPYEKGYKIDGKIEKKLHGLLSRFFGLQAYFSHIGTKKLLQYINRLKPGIIHLHNLHGNFINLKLLLTYIAKKDIPTVLTLHDCWFFTGKCCHYTVDNCYKWMSECCDCPRIHKDNVSWFFDRTRKMFNDKKELFGKIPRLAVVGVSDWITDEANKSFLTNASIIKRVYNWVDSNVFKPIDTDDLRKKLNMNNKFIILGVASKWSEAKGIGMFIEIAEKINDNMVIILVGDIANDINLPKNIIHKKETNIINEIVQYYSMADVLLNMSIEETFGMVTAEALACGTPAIVIDSTACSEVIENNNFGIVVKNRSIKSIFNAIVLIKNKGKHFYSEKCRNRAINLFDKKKILNEYKLIYNSLMSGEGNIIDENYSN